MFFPSSRNNYLREKLQKVLQSFECDQFTLPATQLDLDLQILQINKQLVEIHQVAR